MSDTWTYIEEKLLGKRMSIFLKNISQAFFFLIRTYEEAFWISKPVAA